MGKLRFSSNLLIGGFSLQGISICNGQEKSQFLVGVVLVNHRDRYTNWKVR